MPTPCQGQYLKRSTLQVTQFVDPTRRQRVSSHFPFKQITCRLHSRHWKAFNRLLARLTRSMFVCVEHFAANTLQCVYWLTSDYTCFPSVSFNATKYHEQEKISSIVFYVTTLLLTVKYQYSEYVVLHLTIKKNI